MRDILSFEAQGDGPAPAPPDEGELGFVIQVGPRIYGTGTGLFTTDDEAFIAASHRFAASAGGFNIRPVLPS
jgi:hypothetical protein